VGELSSRAIRSICPGVVEYTIEEQVQVADELQMLPEGSMISEFLKDYAVMRDESRACRLGF
jgi:hypothetical protein